MPGFCVEKQPDHGTQLAKRSGGWDETEPPAISDHLRQIPRLWLFNVSMEHNLHGGFLSHRGTPKSSILIGFSTTNHPFWGTPNLGNLHITMFNKEIINHLWAIFHVSVKKHQRVNDRCSFIVPVAWENEMKSEVGWFLFYLYRWFQLVSYRILWYDVLKSTQRAKQTPVFRWVTSSPEPHLSQTQEFFS